MTFDGKEIQSIYFVGIKGVGMTPLAIFCKEAGCVVSGSDIPDEFITDKSLKEKDIPVLDGFSPVHIPENCDLVIATGAHGGMDNPEVVEAKKRGIPVFMQGEALGKIMEEYMGISVSGTHGKTTTSGLLATLLTKAEKDPSYVVGSGSIRPLGLPGHKGNGNYFVAEADEYVNDPVHDRTTKFLYQHPKVIVITNIDFDHPDVYNSIDDVRDVFLQWCNGLSENGIVIACGDDREFLHIKPSITKPVKTYGFYKDNTYVISDMRTTPGKTHFTLSTNGTNLGEFTIGIAGRHNVLNATAAVATAVELGLSYEEIKEALPYFTGAQRRFEVITKVDRITIVDDYAHHPKEIRETINSSKLWFPHHKIVVLFQPHTYSRTRALLPEFATAFNEADSVGLLPIFSSAREEKDTTISSNDIVQRINAIERKAKYLENKDAVFDFVSSLPSESDTVLLLLGAGDIYHLAPEIAEILGVH